MYGVGMELRHTPAGTRGTTVELSSHGDQIVLHSWLEFFGQ